MSEASDTWSYDQQIQYELARDTLSSLSSILSRQSYILDDKEKAEIYINRSVEISKEKHFFNGFNDAIIKDVIQTYSPLIREYHTLGVTEEEIGDKGLPQEFISNKVDYAKHHK